MRVRVMIDRHVLVVGRHAVERYRERVKPHLSIEDAARELSQVLPTATVEREPPVWIGGDPEPADCWVVLLDAYVFPVTHHELRSCLVRTIAAPAVRAAKRQRKAERRRRARESAREPFSPRSKARARIERDRRRDRSAEL